MIRKSLGWILFFIAMFSVGVLRMNYATGREIDIVWPIGYGAVMLLCLLGWYRLAIKGNVRTKRISGWVLFIWGVLELLTNGVLIASTGLLQGFFIISCIIGAIFVYLGWRLALREHLSRD
ncbi:MAG: hypothetical protein ACOC7P_02990 [Chloroflexota bacterium]